MKKQVKKLSLSKTTIANLNSNLDSLRTNALLGGAAIPTTTASGYCTNVAATVCVCEVTHKKHRCIL